MPVMRQLVLPSSERDNGVEHPVSYFSKRNLPASAAALALVLALKHFDVYVGCAGTLTFVRTDHNPLVFVNQMRTSNLRLIHWAIFLQGFNVRVRHVKGRENVLADMMLRC